MTTIRPTTAQAVMRAHANRLPARRLPGQAVAARGAAVPAPQGGPGA